METMISQKEELRLLKETNDGLNAKIISQQKTLTELSNSVKNRDH